MRCWRARKIVDWAHVRLDTGFVGPLLVIAAVFSLGMIGIAISMFYGDSDAKGYYWCIDQAEEIYRKYNMDKISQVPKLCKKYQGREEKFIERLIIKYAR